MIARRRPRVAPVALFLVSLAAGGLESEAGVVPPDSVATPVRAFRSFDRREWRNLPQSSITALAQDAGGTLWIGTVEGAATFDGAEMRPVRLPDGQRTGYVWTIRSRPRGGVILAATQGLLLFDGRRWSQVPGVSELRAAAEAPDGTLWTLDRDGILRSKSPTGQSTWARFTSPLLDHPAIDFVLTADGQLFVATASDVVRVAPGPAVRMRGGLGADEQVTAVTVARDGTVWAGLSSGAIVATSPSSGRWHRSLESPADRSAMARVRVLLEDRRGRLVAGRSNGHLVLGTPGGRWDEWDEANGLKSAAVISLLADREGTLWVGNSGEGLHQWIGEAWTHRLRWEPQTEIEATAFVESVAGARGNGFLAAVTYHGLWHWDGQRMRQYGRDQGLTENVRSAAEPEPGIIWAGVRFGLFESRGGGRFEQRLSLPRGFVIGFAKSPSGVWHAVTSQHGIYRLTDGQWRPADDINHKLPTAMTRFLAWPSPHECWVSTNQGVTIIAGDGVQQLTATQVPAFLNGASGVLVVSPDEVWVAAESGLAIRSQGKWRSLGIADGLPDDTVHAIAKAVDGSIWIGGPNGIARFREGRWTVFDGRNGLIDAECNLNGLYAAPDGYVYAGTVRSLARFDPAAPDLPLATLSPAWLDLPPLGADGVLRLPSSNRDLLLSWRAPWLLPQPVEYRYRIGPEAQAWSEPQTATQLYVHGISARSHRVEVQARLSGSPGTPWSTPIQLDVYAEPRFLETWRAWLLWSGLGVGVLLGVVEWRTRTLRRRQAQLKTAVDDALSQVKTLRGLLPICAWCKRVRDDQGDWRQIESYIQARAEARFSHGICPECASRQYSELEQSPADANGRAQGEAPTSGQ